ncbi:MAG: BatA domain-containing protein [Planctomycetota bacterium]
MSFYDPAGFWLGLAGAGVLLTHLIRRRARRVTVPFLPLWAAALGERRGGFGSRLMRYLDLLLVLIACAALAVAAARPYTEGTPSTARDLVLVLDGGLELRAGDRHRLLWHVARAEIQRRAPGTRFLIVRVGEGRDISVRCADVRTAMAEVSRHQPAWQRRSPDDALTLARAAAADLRDPDFVFVTYRTITPEDWRLRVVKQDAQNAGFASLEVTGDPEGGGRFARVALRGEGYAKIGEHWAGELVAGEPTVLQLPLPREGEAEFTIVLEGDAFAADDTIRLLLPGRESPRPLVVSDTGEVSPFLISALMALEATGAITGPLEQTVPARAAEAAKKYSVVIFDRCAPPRTLTGVPALYLSPPVGALPFRVGEEHAAPALFHVKREHPLVRGIDLERIPPLNGRAVLGGEAIASAAPGALLAIGPAWVALGFDPDRCIFASTPAYPLFLRNTIEWLAKVTRRSAPEFYRVGETAPQKGLVRIDGEVVHRVGQQLIGPPGVWQIEKRRYAVNLLEPELDLAPATADSDPLPAVGEAGVPDQPHAALFAAIAAGVLLIAWWVFWRS